MPDVSLRFLRSIVLTWLVASSAAGSAGAQSPTVKRLTVDEAVRLALEQNLGLQAERLNPRMQDAAIAQARSLWTPTVSSSVTANSINSPSTNIFAGGRTKVTDTRVGTEVGITQTLPTGGRYAVTWNTSRLESTNIFTNFNPLLDSNLRLEVTQPLLRNFKIDDVRQRLETSRRDRTGADLELQSAIVSTTRQVRNAYWDLVYEIDSLSAARQSLELARRQLADNERRVQVGTMASIDTVEAQAEVARNEEAVIVAESAIEDAEDRLRALIFGPDSPDFWTASIEPADTAPFRPQALDVAGAIRHALEARLDLKIARNAVARTDVEVRYLRNQTLPDVSAQVSYAATAVGGSQLTPLTSIPIGDEGTRPVLTRRSFGSVLGDLVTGSFPAWTVGMTVSVPVGTSTAEADLARSRLRHTQQDTELRNLELQAAVEVRTAARQVQTNQKRVDTTRAARELAERRLDAAQKKFAAGIETTFFVFQAQRDLAQARTNEVRAIADYNKALVDFEAVQEISIRD